MVITAKFTVRQKFSRKRHRKTENLKRTALGSFHSITTFNLFTTSINPTKKNRMCRHIHQLVHPVLLYNLNLLSDHQKATNEKHHTTKKSTSFT